jgi:type II secretory pathway pseudopilin PulG
MVKVCRKILGKVGARSKSGFGITEALVAAAVLGFLYVAVLNLQGSNRDALLRIRGRDGATEVAQQIIDSLNTVGIANLADDMLASCGNGCLTLPKKGGGTDSLKYLRVWKGQPGAIETDMRVEYTAGVKISPDAEYMSRKTSLLLGEDTIKHVYAKRLDVTVTWKFKGTPHSITVSGVIR